MARPAWCAVRSTRMAPSPSRVRSGPPARTPAGSTQADRSGYWAAAAWYLTWNRLIRSAEPTEMEPPDERRTYRQHRRARGFVGAGGWDPEPVDSGCPRVQARGRISAWQVHWRAWTWTGPAHSIHRPAGVGGPARAVRRSAAPVVHYQGQRADPDRLPGLPPGDR